ARRAGHDLRAGDRRPDPHRVRGVCLAQFPDHPRGGARLHHCRVDTVPAERHRAAVARACRATRSADMSALLELEGVTRRFGGLNAVEGVSFSVAQGEIVGLIGPNGAGKTTLIDVITGVHPANHGRVRFDGQDITHRRPHQIARLGLARTFQIVQPFPKMTVCGASSVHDAYAAARQQLEFTGLADLTDRPAATLTLARRKRLELAKSLAMKPRLLML